MPTIKPVLVLPYYSEYEQYFVFNFCNYHGKYKSKRLGRNTKVLAPLRLCKNILIHPGSVNNSWFHSVVCSDLNQ